MTTKKYLYLIAISASTLLITSCGKSDKVENTDNTEEFVSTETPTSIEPDTNSNEVISDAKTISTDTKNIDKMLDDYEEYVDQYIVYAKKINNGDMTAMKEYTEIMQKANDYAESMEKVKDDEEVTPAQMKRMLEIQTKMAGAISTK